MDSGWASFWVTVIGTFLTLGGLVVAVALGRHEVRNVRRELAERDEERRVEEMRRRSAQATTVSALLTVTRNEYTREPTFAFVEVYNGSALPIYQVSVVLPWAGGAVVPRVHEQVVPGGQRAHIHVHMGAALAMGAGAAVQVNFRDSAGQWWHRGEDGHLCALEDDPYPRELAQSAPEAEEASVSR